MNFFRALKKTTKKDSKRIRSKPRLGMETLEGRDMLTAVVMSDYDQLIVELVNRARQDPLAEVSRSTTVSDLNQGLPAGTISSTPKQPLASVQALVDAGSAHALDMLEKDYFDHYSQPGGESPTDRAVAAGYSGSVGENIAWNGSTGTIDQIDETVFAHEALFHSPSHRENLMFDSYEEAGMAAEFGQYTSGGTTFNAAMIAEEFGFNSGNPYLTGVAFDDSVINDDFYSVGESESGVVIVAVDNSSGARFSTQTGTSGGYNMKLPAGTYNVTASGGRLDEAMVVSNVTIASVNVKVDFDTSTSTYHAQDIVGFNAGEEFWVGESNGVSSLATTYYGDWSSSTSYSHLGTGDFNGDGLDDVVGRATSDGKLHVGLSTGSSSFSSSVWGGFTTISSWSDIVVGDFDGDGLDDVLGRADIDGTFWLARSTGTSFQNSYWGGLVNTVTWSPLYVGDYNGDGRTDTAARAADGTWWASISNGSRLNNGYWGKWSTGVTWSDVSVGDFNGDGFDDIAGRANNAYWWVNRSSGINYFFVEYWSSWTGTVTWDDVTVGDFDGDGKDDIAGRANGQWWLAMSNGTKFSNEYWGYWTTGTTWSDVSLIDVNGDRKDDIIGRASSGQWWVFTSNGSNFVGQLATTWSPAATWTDVFVGNLI